MHIYSKLTHNVILDKFYINSDHKLIINQAFADGVMQLNPTLNSFYSKIDTNESKFQAMAFIPCKM